MTTLAINNSRFDPIEYIKRLRNLGVNQEVAEVQAQELEHVLETAIDIVKKDIFTKELATKADLGTTKAELQKEIAALRYDTLKFIIWTGVGIVVTLGGMLAKGFHWW
jgi:hypothetical protein